MRRWSNILLLLCMLVLLRRQRIKAIASIGVCGCGHFGVIERWSRRAREQRRHAWEWDRSRHVSDQTKIDIWIFKQPMHGDHLCHSLFIINSGLDVNVTSVRSLAGQSARAEDELYIPEVQLCATYKSSRYYLYGLLLVFFWICIAGILRPALDNIMGM